MLEITKDIFAAIICHFFQRQKAKTTRKHPAYKNHTSPIMTRKVIVNGSMVRMIVIIPIKPIRAAIYTRTILSRRKTKCRAAFLFGATMQIFRRKTIRLNTLIEPIKAKLHSESVTKNMTTFYPAKKKFASTHPQNNIIPCSIFSTFSSSFSQHSFFSLSVSFFCSSTGFNVSVGVSY